MLRDTATRVVGVERKTASLAPSSPPPRRVALFFFGATGEENIPEHRDEAGSVVKLAPPLIPKHALRNYADRGEQQSQPGGDAQPIFAEHTMTLVFVNTEHPANYSAFAESARQP